MNKITVGVDVGGTNTVFGFIDTDGNYLFGDSLLTNADEDANKFIKRLAEAIKNMYEAYKNEYLLIGIGIAAPTANYFLGTIESPSNLKWGRVNFVTIMKEYFDLPIAITNDANAAALGEYEFGYAKGMKNFIVITLGTGLGSGIVVDGNLLYGESGLAGELGHFIVIPNGRACNCGRFGCLETYASANGVKRTAFELLANYNDDSELRNIPYNKITGKIISSLAANGDIIALKAFDFTGEILGRTLANLVVCFTSEAIILFGGFVDSGELLLEPTRRYFENNLLNFHKGKIKLLKSKLENGKAAILGASSLVASKINQRTGFQLNQTINN